MVVILRFWVWSCGDMQCRRGSDLIQQNAQPDGGALVRVRIFQQNTARRNGQALSIGHTAFLACLPEAITGPLIPARARWPCLACLLPAANPCQPWYILVVPQTRRLNHQNIKRSLTIHYALLPTAKTLDALLLTKSACLRCLYIDMASVNYNGPGSEYVCIVQYTLIRLNAFWISMPSSLPRGRRQR